MANWEIVPRKGRAMNTNPTLTVTKDGGFFMSKALSVLLGGQGFKVVRDAESGAFALIGCKESEIGKTGFRIGKNPKFPQDEIREHMKLSPGDVLAVKPMDNVLVLVRKVEE